MSANHSHRANGNSQSDEHNADSRTPLLTKRLPRPALITQRIALLFQDWWLWELASASIAILATTAIIVILVLYDESSLPNWPSVFTLNSTISFFAVIAKLAFTSAVGASISQSKWLWFRQDKPRPLQDLQLFDDASRGPWGALSLLFSVKARHLAFFGASITVLLLLFDPFLQQVVIYPDRLVAAERAATIVRAQRYQARGDEGLPLPSTVDISMKAAVYSGIFDVKDQADVLVDHSCATGNCTWEGFASLAVCSKCVNITAYVEKSCNSSGCYQLALPGGPSLFGFGGQINSSITNISSNLHGIGPSVVQFSSLISKTTDNSDNTTAWECALFYCVNSYAATVTDGRIQQQISSSWRNDSATYTQSSDLIYNPPSQIINITANASNFKVANLAAKAMNTFMSLTFTGSDGINGTVTGSAFSSDVVHALYDTTDYPHRIGNLATSMTNNIRQQNDSGSAPFNGQAFTTETYVRVRWAWFSYPAIVIVSSLLYLVGTILETTYRDVAIWKSSNMAMLFHGQALGLDDPDRVPVTTLSEMSELYKDIKVDLVQTDDNGWKLVQRSVE